MKQHHRLAGGPAAALLATTAALSPASATQIVDIAFVRDTIGTMGSSVDGVARKVGPVAAAARSLACDLPSFINKRGKTSNESVTGKGDLIADTGSGRMTLDQIKEEELPPAIRALSKPERRVAIEQQSNQRREPNAKLADLAARRDVTIAERRAKTPSKSASSFDLAIETTLKAQIRK